MAAVKAHSALMDATAAAEAEGLFTPTVEQTKMIARLRDLNARKAAIDAEVSAIKEKILAEMDEMGARALTVNGRSIVAIVPKTKSEFYADQYAAMYPEVAAMFAEAKAAYDEHVPEFTFRVAATPAHTFPGAS